MQRLLANSSRACAFQDGNSAKASSGARSNFKRVNVSSFQSTYTCFAPDLYAFSVTRRTNCTASRGALIDKVCPG